MPKFQPFSKVGTRKFVNMEQVNLQQLYENMVALEQRLNTLQLENAQLRNQNAAPAQAQADIFRIPDPIKSIPTFDGNKKQLSAWLATVERTLQHFEGKVTPDVLSIYEQAIINKIDGKARDTICVNGNPTTIDEVTTILKAIYGDRNDMSTYQTQLWTLKMEESLHLYYKRTKEIMQSMKSLAKEKQSYRDHWDAINEFLDQECLAAFINGLNKAYFGYAQASKPEDLESAYAFLCKFQNAEQTKKHTQQPSNLQKNFGNFRNNKPDNRTEAKNQPYSASKPFKQQSDRQKITPMEIDPSLRSSYRNKINHHDTTEDVENKNECTEDENESDFEDEVNFQISQTDNDVK